MIQNLTNAFDADGNIYSITDALTSARNQSFTFDNLNRLKTASGLYGSLTYTYDKVGNRLTLANGTSTDTYAISSTANQVNTVTTSGSGNVRSFSYLPTGQASGDTRNPSSAYVYTYNLTGRLASASLNGTTVGTYLMNGLEQRVSKTVGSTTTQFVFDRYGHLMAEADGATGAIQKEYIWLDDLPVAEVDNTGSSPVIYYVHTDHLGRPQKMTDATATIVWDGVFDPFGNVTSVTGSATNLLMFPGQYYDSETQLSQNWFRDYDPTIGRYIQSDPIGLWSETNTYSYADGNPMTKMDRFGLSTVTYDRANGTMTIYDRNGNQTGQYPAANNTTRACNCPWPNGTYPYGYHTPHPESGSSGPYGSNGNYVFLVPGHEGLGIHSGRNGPQSRTEGCIRTNDAGTAALGNANASDPITSLTVH